MAWLGNECDRRQHIRYVVDWKSSIWHHSNGVGGEIFHDRICDISLAGAGLYSEADIYTEALLVMLIETPLPYGKFRKVIAGIQCILCKPTFSEERRQFHMGIQFQRFHGIDKHLLAEALFTQKQVAERHNQEPVRLI
jgi:hypothetical protein